MTVVINWVHDYDLYFNLHNALNPLQCYIICMNFFNTTFKFIITQIKLIEQRPPLWDKFNDDYWLQRKKNNCREIFTFLENNFEEMSNEDQHKIVEFIVHIIVYYTLKHKSATSTFCHFR